MGKPKSQSFKISVQVLALTALLFLGYQNCTNYNDPSLFEPGKVTAASQSTPAEVRLDSPSGVIDIPAAIKMSNFTSLQVGGDCNLGLKAKKHFIEVRMLDANNAPVSVKVDSRCPPNGTALPADCFKADYFRCEHGQYYIHLPLHCGMYRGQTQSLYKLQGQLVTIDEQGVQSRDNKAQFERFLTIGWPPGC